MRAASGSVSELDDDVAIKVERVSKKYCKSLKRTMLYGMSDILRNTVGLRTHSDRLRKTEFWAVDDVSFEVKKGETLGIIGPNGSGKTTMLKMLNGIFWPDKGKISIRGKVGALIAVGAGFHPMLTGRENIYVNAAILGMTKKEVDAKFDDIIEFADIGDFLDTPVKFYSSGMYVRLGFAVAVHCEPEILLIDEILAVGDHNFHQKCYKKIGELVKKGTTIVLVSHSMNLIQMICDNCILMETGRIAKFGKTLDVIADYYRISQKRMDESKNINKIRLDSFIIQNKDGNTKTKFETGEYLCFKWKFKIGEKIEKPSLYLGLRSDLYHGYSTKYDMYNIDYIDDTTIITLEIPYLGLAPGIYTISLGIKDENFIGAYYLEYTTGAYLEVRSDKPIIGRFILDHKWNVKQNE